MGKIFTKEEAERILALPKEELNKLKRGGNNRGYLFDKETNDKLAALEEKQKKLEDGKETRL
jgi:hypothetical protein